MLEREAKRRGVKLGELTKPEYLEPILKKYTFTDLESLYGAVGFGGIPSIYVISRLMEEQRSEADQAAQKKGPTLPAPETVLKQGKPTHGIYVERVQDAGALRPLLQPGAGG